ncbi:type II toxin-antitoxin system VapC family toxin [Microvirga pudoricolor]|uniref:type II toxin-antitoxin system VapC family toxin n=1 Tax=Microvirga pudoricolor TaxID=2778729 RepID=UPI0019524FBA|nr:type II toxin-antitoxin system VapC family toxin [Microvirga pudoricolor]MBM6593930.1 type II toxin-antitoxin system VapC family toxin [Microvirga pudoricolor]
MFLDASAVLGILLNEPDRDALLSRIEASRTPLTTSPLATMEAVTGFAARRSVPVEDALEVVMAFMTSLKVRTISITPEIGAGAIRAYATYGKGHGKGRGTSAKLNMGDCFAYACAKNYGLPLLHKGHEFSETDLRQPGD